MARTASVLLTLAGAAALLLSAFQPWYEGREPPEVKLTDLFTGLQPEAAGATAASMLLLLAGAAAVAVLGLLLRAPGPCWPRPAWRAWPRAFRGPCSRAARWPPPPSR
ncbi:hypothetical protein ACLQ2N_35200 [Streptomyces sp. DT224]|uniref:hypothetical protein n=1 Tax=Streptomyces sp. DT224 TaxID=3393426 RepID=UPI003CE9A0F5